MTLKKSVTASAIVAVLLGSTAALATTVKSSKTSCVNGRCTEKGTYNGVTPFTRRYNQWDVSRNQLQQDAIVFVATQGAEIGSALRDEASATGMTAEQAAATVIKADGIVIGAE